MKKLLLLVSLFLTTFLYGQNDILSKLNTADSLLKSGNALEAYNILKEIEPKCDTKDTLYDYILLYFKVQ